MLGTRAAITKAHLRNAPHREPHRHVCRRTLTTRITPVDLRYDCIHAPDGNKTDRPLVILHGLFGMKRNWLSLSKAFAKDLKRPVYALDLRNHGSSPHAEPMTYEAMANDVVHFFENHSLTNISLLGHSMGGKAAMALALSPVLPPGLLRHLIVADIAPARSKLSDEFNGYAKAMMEIEAANVSTRQEAQHMLAPYEADPMTRAFLLTNLDTSGSPLRFRIPLNIISNSIHDLGDFPYNVGERIWEGKALFIKGLKSKYINNKNLPISEAFFPNMTMKTLDAGHWVHAERPTEFRHYVVDFIKNN